VEDRLKLLERHGLYRLWLGRVRCF
jgi:hypothetical protein